MGTKECTFNFGEWLTEYAPQFDEAIDKYPPLVKLNRFSDLAYTISIPSLEVIQTRRNYLQTKRNTLTIVENAIDMLQKKLTTEPNIEEVSAQVEKLEEQKNRLYDDIFGQQIQIVREYLVEIEHVFPDTEERYELEKVEGRFTEKAISEKLPLVIFQDIIENILAAGLDLKN